ncbi:hypothetical protein M2351_007140 [Azospirillum canadense]|nr:hypothetical protein [Azospirillum canadense]
MLETAGQLEGAGLLRHAAAETRRRLGALGPAPDAPPPGSAAAEGARPAGLLRPGGLTVAGALRLALRDAEEVVNTYLDIADRATDQRVLEEAQKHAEQAMGRLALVRSLLADPDES